MRKKALFLAIFLGIVGVLLSSDQVLAASQKSKASQKITLKIPEKNGIYNVPGHPRMKVRVFIHYPKFSFSKAPALPACSVTDENSAALVGHNPGSLPAGNWKYFVNYSSAPSTISRTELQTLVHNAFQQWETKTDLGSSVNFVDSGSTKATGYNPLDGKNVIAWGNLQSGVLAETAAVYDTETGKMIETDTIFNSKKTIKWDWTSFSLTACPNVSRYDAQNVLTHEIGHWLGLKDELGSAYANNTMYGYASMGEIKKDTLTQGDIDGANVIY